MDPSAKLIVVLFVVGLSIYGIHLWLQARGRQTVGKVTARINTTGRYAMRYRIVVRRRIITADIPEVELHLGSRTVIRMSADEARRMADDVEEAARLAADGA